MIEEYEKLIELEKRKLFLIQETLLSIKKIYSNEKHKAIIEKQVKLFYDFLRNKERRNIPKYNKLTSSNLSKLYVIVTKEETIEIQQNIKDSDMKYTTDELSEIEGAMLRSQDLQELIQLLSNMYIKSISEIDVYEQMIYNVQNKKEPEKMNEEEHEEYQSLEESNPLLTGPKKKTWLEKLKRVDTDIADMNYLYGLAIDILVMMEEEQSVTIKYDPNKGLTIDTIAFPRIDNFEMKRDYVFNKYGVTSIDELLNKYERIRNEYYKNYISLTQEQKEKYKLSNYNVTELKFSLDDKAELSGLLYILQRENYGFPPTKNDLIALINKRILNGRNFELVEPKEDEPTNKAIPQRQSKYAELETYYKNLTKNMTIEEISKLYSNIVSEIKVKEDYAEKSMEGHHAIMQKMFSNIILQKRDISILLKEQELEEALKEIVEKELKEKMKFTLSTPKEISNSFVFKEREEEYYQEEIIESQRRKK